MGARTFLTRLFAGEAGVQAMHSRRWRKIRDLPDRKLMAEAYIPAFATEGGKILWVGSRAYTAEDYPVLESQGAEVWTTDIDPDAARWGVQGRHRTGDICEADTLFADHVFDAIVCNGVLGFGVDAPDQQRKCLQALSRILKPGGRLLLGWNVDKIGDPIAASLTKPWFLHEPFAGQPARVTFAETTHVYDAFVRRAPAA